MSQDRPSDPAVKYCTQCEGEFVATLDTCPDCGVALVAEDPGAVEPVEVFTTVELGLLPLVRSTLGDAGIEFEEIERDLSHGIMGEIRQQRAILVAQPDAERAIALLDNLEHEAAEAEPPH